MGRKSYFAFIAALAAIFAMTTVAPAEAGRGHGKGGYGKGWKGGRYVQNNYYVRRGGNNWNAFGAGLVGLGVGAVIGSALTPRTVYVAPPARPVGYRPEPWTEDWYAYCSSRYRSFNPRSGTYLGYDGYEHFCR
jgi:hypothetical protein